MITRDNPVIRLRSYVLVVALVAGLAAQVGPGAARAGGLPTPVLVAWYGFDGRSNSVSDLSGKGHTMTVVATHGALLRPVIHGSGDGLAFPTKCRTATGCPHVVLQSPSEGDLNPGTRRIAFGATVRLAHTQTSKGQNVVQKGYSATSSQYKLQVDGGAGRPSCVLVDELKEGIQLVRSSVSVADGGWHTIECRRSSVVFDIVVDGVLRGVVTVPAALSVTNNMPLSIGGKGAYRNNDQFQGAVDDVWVRIG